MYVINHHEFLLPLTIMIWFCAEEIRPHTCLHHFWLNLWTLAHTLDIAFSRIKWLDQQVTCWTCAWPMVLYVTHLDCLFNQTDSLICIHCERRVRMWFDVYAPSLIKRIVAHSRPPLYLVPIKLQDKWILLTFLCYCIQTRKAKSAKMEYGNTIWDFGNVINCKVNGGYPSLVVWQLLILTASY